jgi:ribonuclease R
MPRVERLAFVCDMRVSKHGKLSKTRFYEAVIRSHARLTYDEAWATCANPKAAPTAALTPAVRASLDSLHEVYGALKIARDARGALDFRGGEVKARIGADGTDRGLLRSDCATTRTG